jgi:uncharacterized protein YggU (UPF0235/DUF167 family)
VRLTPRSGRDAVEDVEQAADGSSHLKVRVRAVPEKGKANTALEALLGSALGVPASAVTVVVGDTSRLKTVHVAGDATMLAAMVEGLRSPR